MVGSVVSRNLLGGDDIAFIYFAEPLTRYVVAACTALSPPTSFWRIPLILLMKLATYRMTTQDRWHIALLRQVVSNNGIKVARSVKCDTSQFSDAQKPMDRQDICARQPPWRHLPSFCVGWSPPRSSLPIPLLSFQRTLWICSVSWLSFTNYLTFAPPSPPPWRYTRTTRRKISRNCARVPRKITPGFHPVLMWSRRSCSWPSTNWLSPFGRRSVCASSPTKSATAWDPYIAGNVVWTCWARTMLSGKPSKP